MQTTRLRGLNGKARMLRQRDRATQFHARQLLDEYLEPGPFENRPARYIPIRSRSDFLPAVSVWREELGEIERECSGGVQFDLAFDEGAPIRCDVRPPIYDTTTTGPSRTSGQPTPKWVKPKGSFQVARGPKRTSAFNLNRFAYGFLLGSAAAAVVLLVVTIAVG